MYNQACELIFNNVFTKYIRWFLFLSFTSLLFALWCMCTCVCVAHSIGALSAIQKKSIWDPLCVCASVGVFNIFRIFHFCVLFLSSDTIVPEWILRSIHSPPLYVLQPRAHRQTHIRNSILNFSCACARQKRREKITTITKAKPENRGNATLYWTPLPKLNSPTSYIYGKILIKALRCDFSFLFFSLWAKTDFVKCE